MSLYRDRGVVLRTYKLGEADRIVVLITSGHGKVRAVAKGVRRTKSRFGGRLEPLSHVELLLYEGRELDIVTQAEIIEPWRPLHEDLTVWLRGWPLRKRRSRWVKNGSLRSPCTGCWWGPAHSGRTVEPTGRRRLLLEIALARRRRPYPRLLRQLWLEPAGGASCRL